MNYLGKAYSPQHFDPITTVFLHCWHVAFSPAAIFIISCTVWISAAFSAVIFGVLLFLLLVLCFGNECVN